MSGAGGVPGPETRPPASVPDRLPVLDGVRGLAIVMIMQYHFWELGFGFMRVDPTLPIDRWAFALREVGWTSVDLFFVLSGFLITGILVDAKPTSDRYFRNFYARRFLRIFPCYYVFLAIILVLAARLHPGPAFAAFPEFRAVQGWFWSYLVNVASSVPALGARIPIVYSHFWTLALEEQFYLLWPLVVFALDRRGLRRACWAMIVGALALRVAVVSGALGSLLYVNAAHVLTPARMDTLALGALIALAARDRAELERLSRWAPRVAVAGVGILAGLFAWRGGLALFDPVSLTLGFTVVGFTWAAVLVIAITSPPRALVPRLLGHPVLQTFGRYSYCMYIVHLLVGFGLAYLCVNLGLVVLVGGSHLPMDIALCAAATGACLAIAFVSWHLLEKQFLKLKGLFPYEGAVRTVRVGDAERAAGGLAAGPRIARDPQ